MSRADAGPRQDRAQAVALALDLLVVPTRLWSVVTMPAAAVSVAFPPWAQLAVATLYAVQAVVEVQGRDRWRSPVAFVCALAAGASASLVLLGDSDSPNWVYWVGQSVLQLWVMVRAREQTQ